MTKRQAAEKIKTALDHSGKTWSWFCENMPGLAAKTERLTQIANGKSGNRLSNDSMVELADIAGLSLEFETVFEVREKEST